jgi:uncharacterized protein
MTYYAVCAWDAPGSHEPRHAVKAEHFAHIETVMDKVAIAGPLRDAEGANVGSLFILKVDTSEEAEAFLRADPYFAAGVWDRWTVDIFLPAIGEWIGGKIW